MLARITYGLVGLALIALVAGFFQKTSNVLLYASIVLSLAAIVLVVVGAARRAREVPATEPVYADDEALAPAALTLDGDEFPDEEYDDEEEEEEPAALFEDEDEEEEEEAPVRATRPRPSRAASTTKTASRTPARATGAGTRARQPAKAPAKAATKASTVVVVPGRDRFHTANCRFIQDKGDVEELSTASAKRRGYQACSVCKPE